MSVLRSDENLAYHAARLVLLVALCGKPRSGGFAPLPGIHGRMLLAKLDFFLRYPAYLKRAAAILGTRLSDEELGLAPDSEVHSVESRMVRYLYGPWDHIYYPSLAYLIGKRLVAVQVQHGTEIFYLTREGKEVSDRLRLEPEYAGLARRARAIHRLFSNYTGSRLKDFIYTNFPEVVNREMGAQI